MSRFNQAAPSAWEPNVTNAAGAPAYGVDPRYEIASILLTSFVKDTFYRSKEIEQARLIELINQVDVKFAAKAALFARNEYGMRSVSHIVAGEIATMGKSKGLSWTGNFFQKIARRPDDMLEILGYYSAKNPTDSKIRKIPNAMKRGFGKRLAQFDEYQLGKYRSHGKAITLIDLVNLIRPKSTPALDKLMKKLLVSDNTFEGEMALAGRAAEEVEVTEGQSREVAQASIKAEAWGDLITNRKIGYMALLKNLANIAKQAPQYLGAALQLLQDEKMIRKSLVLPFRYWTAYEELQKQNPLQSRTILPALAAACDIALKNVPSLPGRTLVALDKSGSMRAQLNIASQFAAVLYKANDADLMIFDTSALYLVPSPAEATLTIQQMILANCQRLGGTDFNSVFVEAAKKERKYDRIVFISDEQHWAGNPIRATYQEYCKRYGVRSSIFMINTAGLGSLTFPEEKVYAVAGFSEKIFDLMKGLEEDRNALVNRIEAVEI